MQSRPAVLPQLLLTAEKRKLCLIDGEKTLSYMELDSETSNFAHSLESLGVRKGDRVALFLPNCWQHVVSMYGALKLGAICVPLDYRSTQREIEFFLQNSKPTISIVSSSKSDLFPSNKIEVNPDSNSPISESFDSTQEHTVQQHDPALLLYTGGTTGFPKGVVLTHGNIIHVLSGLSNAWRLRKGEEIFAQFLPMTHSGGLNCNLNSALYNGGTTLILRRFEASALLEQVERLGITAFSGVPTIYNSLIRAPDIENRDLSSLRLCFSSGAPLSPETADTFRKKTGITINVGWGLTEASPQLTVAPLGIYRQNYVGIPIEDTQVVALDEALNRLPFGEIGELAARGPQVMSSYHENEEETRKVFTRDGWLLTGDFGYVGTDGVYLIGRKKEVINTGGYKVWPSEVEGVLLENELVLEACVVGVRDDYYGEAVKAFIVAKSAMSEQEILGFCKKRLSSYKVPKHIEFRTSLPKSSVGKILRRSLLSGP